MPPFRKPTLVTLRRQNPSQAWGFRLGGGAELGQSFQIQKVCIPIVTIFSNSIGSIRLRPIVWRILVDCQKMTS